MGFGVVCSGILGLVILYSIFQGLSQEETRYLAGFGFGASSIALFARVGGIYIQRQQMLEPISSERSRPDSPKTIHATPLTLLTTLEMLRAWVLICLSLSLDQ